MWVLWILFEVFNFSFGRNCFFPRKITWQNYSKGERSLTALKIVLYQSFIVWLVSSWECKILIIIILISWMWAKLISSGQLLSYPWKMFLGVPLSALWVNLGGVLMFDKTIVLVWYLSRSIVPRDQHFAKYNFVEICFVLLQSVLELRER